MKKSSLRHARPSLALSRVLPGVLAMLVLAACSGLAVTEPEVAPEAGTAEPISAAPTSVAPASSPAANGPAGTGLATGLPCDVQAVIESRCITCHGGPTVNDAGAGPPPLLTYADLAAPANRDPQKSRAQLSLQYMLSKTMPPAPAQPPEDDEIAAFDTWLKAGATKNATACTDPPPASLDGGVAVDAGVRCTSGKLWTDGDKDSPLMHPGAACNACHQLNDGPNLRIAGTIFPTLHEPNDCNGSSSRDLQILVTDARGRSVKLDVNAAGNFLGKQRLQPPLKAVITDGKKTRAMNGSVTSGDCNSCHTTAGVNGAPGRIMAP